MKTTSRQCPTCGDEQLFEQPECQDGHGECPEWVCTECGFALLAGVLAEPADAPGVGAAA